jgi:hypothetical protein
MPTTNKSASVQEAVLQVWTRSVKRPMMSPIPAPARPYDANVIAALVRFSGMGYLAVAILIGSGLINAWMLVGSPERLITTFPVFHCCWLADRQNYVIASSAPCTELVATADRGQTRSPAFVRRVPCKETHRIARSIEP